MAVEIGTLVVKGTFGSAPADRDAAPSVTRQELELWRRDLLSEMRDMLEDAQRRAGER